MTDEGVKWMMENILKASAELIVAQIINKVLTDGGIEQCIKVDALQHKMDIRRKRATPKRYQMLKVKRSCKDYAEYGDAKCR
jgi:D-mannonate dehydratase